MVLQLADIHTVQKYCAHAQLSQEDKGTFHIPTRDKPSPTAGGRNFSPSSRKERFFSKMSLLVCLAQTDMILNIIQFHTNSLLSARVNHQIAPVPASHGQLDHAGGKHGTPCRLSRVAEWPRGATLLPLCQLGYRAAAPGSWPAAPEPARSLSSQKITPG